MRVTVMTTNPLDNGSFWFGSLPEPPSAEPPGSLPDRVDVAIDVSHGAAVADHLDWALETDTNLVIGATGWTLPDLAGRIDERQDWQPEFLGKAHLL